MKETNAYIGVGSNLGIRPANLRRALNLLKEARGLHIEKVSSTYECSSVGPRQRDFLNGVLKVKTYLMPSELLSILKGIEKKMGRKKTVRWGPRVIDLDLLLYGQLRTQSPQLTLPHPQLHKRRFVLVPLCEIAPRIRIPVLSGTPASLLHRLTDPSQRVILFK